MLCKSNHALIIVVVVVVVVVSVVGVVVVVVVDEVDADGDVDVGGVAAIPAEMQATDGTALAVWFQSNRKVRNSEISVSSRHG